ncbi:MAG: HU family DNA-binding protein [Rhodococcus sp. (in: high G+C Gram-positive bacteria)]|nr:MAG: HU family DNA-binding protein [Rhodococcus sp. (in: high G+C Gram-positive bacteria)]
MNKKELTEAAAGSLDVSRAEVERVLDALTDAIGGALAKGDSVAIAGFGTFEVRHRAARTGRNPQTGAEIQIAASNAPAFKPASALKKSVN